MENTILEHFKNAFILNHQSDIPLYKQIENYVISQVRLGNFKQGEKMISENELCALFNISRTTVRQAMDGLYKKGIVSKVRGKGTFIANEKIQSNINQLYNFSESISALGLEPSSVILSNQVIDADEHIAAKLNLPSQQTKVFKLKRIRQADNRPILIEVTYIPYYLCQGIEHVNFEHRSLYNVLEKIFQLNVNLAEETIDALVINRKETAKLLNCSLNTAGFFVQRLSYLSDGTIVEYTHSIASVEKCSFKLTLPQGKKDNISFAKLYQ